MPSRDLEVDHAGDIGAAHVSALAQARTPVTEAAMARDEELLACEFHNRARHRRPDPPPRH